MKAKRLATNLAKGENKLERRLLLRQAVQRAETPNKIHGMNSDDVSIRKKLTQYT